MLKKSKVLALMLVSSALSICAIRPAFAQAQAPEVLLVNQSGCKLYFPSFSQVLDVQLHKVEGNCVNGFFNGAVIYGVSLNTQTTKNRTGVYAGILQQGRFDGLTLYLEGGFVRSRDPKFGGYWHNKNDASYNLAKVIDGINDMAEKSNSPLANANRLQLLALAASWDRNPADFVSAYTKDTGSPRVSTANNMPSTSTQGTTPQDDPKVFGRSARGG